jgi:hypothetical protein
MDRKLKFSKRFIPCPVDDGDEMYPNGIFVFNITKMAAYIQMNGLPCEEILVKDYRSHSKFNEEHLPNADLAPMTATNSSTEISSPVSRST